MTRLQTYLLTGLLISTGALAQTTSSQTSGLRSRGKAFNPDIGANFIGLLQRGTGVGNARTDSSHNGLSLQEAELQFSADVDVYFRAVSLFAVKQEEGATEFGIDPEEVFVESLALPYITLRAGKMKLAFGRHNLLHTHAYPFLDAPLINQLVFGEEGLNEVGVSAAVLIPASWFSEVTLQGFNPSNENLYDSPESGEIGGLAHLKNLWDLTPDLTLEHGVSGTLGKDVTDNVAHAMGTDVTVKWRPAEDGKYQALSLSGEYILRNPASFGGMAMWAQYQFAQRWWAQARYEYLGIPHEEGVGTANKQSLLIGFFPSEFSGLRLQYDHIAAERTDHTIALQFNVSIGAHPAHEY